MPLDNVVFWVFAPLSIATAIGMMVVRNAVHAALFLVVNFFTIAVMYLLLDAPFLFAVQIVVYAGAIMVLFLFVIMLLGVDRGDPLGERLFGQRTTAVILAVAIVAEAATAIRAGVGFATRAPEGFEAANPGGNPSALADVLFRDYFFPFEVTSILLIVAAVAAMVLALRRSRSVTQREIEEHEGDDLEAYAMAPPGAPQSMREGTR
ncbi:MAG TPA: NADH-quinone oxidoreductase subunit J [Actinomycetota bacterium]|nr:NADH-quinone oxidoreductase subunit J [Actinomycetota bacterium]